MPDTDRSSSARGGELVLRGGRVIDASGERMADVRVADGRVVEVGAALTGDRVLDAEGCIVAPGLVDLHVHLREPGGEDAETIETGARAAALGGFTAVVAMPNTEPPQDDPAVVAAVLAAGAASVCDVHAAGAITRGRAGEELAPMGELHALGVRIFTDDGACVASAGVMRSALEYAGSLPGAVLGQHAEDPTLATGHMHEGEWSSRLGIPGRPAIAEETIIARDCALVELTGTPVHFLHVSTAGSVEIVRAARARGLPVTAEVAPHHFTLTDACCASFDPRYKVHPPLRTEADIAAIKAGLADGTIDAIASDHAPHPTESKERPFEDAPPGMLGLETALALTLTELVEPGVLSLTDALARLSWGPAAIAGLAEHGRTIEAGASANLCVIDPRLEWQVEAERLASRARNTPYEGRRLTGKARHTICRGEAVVIDGEAQR
ncbi:MAG TPA: dihydroorotase [Acidimicrobiia bacterium]|nr:dihydroorotase [Acidimicrobiia bacterium]